MLSWRCSHAECSPVLMAEVVAHYFPRLVELHNYSQANSVRKKMYNWSTMNGKQVPRAPNASPSADDYVCAYSKGLQAHGLPNR